MGSLKKSVQTDSVSLLIRDWRGHGMLGRKERDQLELLITGSLRQLIPDDHVLVRVDRVLDLSWLRDEVADLTLPRNFSEHLGTQGRKPLRSGGCFPIGGEPGPIQDRLADPRSGTFKQGDIVHERYYAGHRCGLGREQHDRCLLVAMPSIALFCLVPILGGADRLNRLVPSIQLALVRVDSSEDGI